MTKKIVLSSLFLLGCCIASYFTIRAQIDSPSPMLEKKEALPQKQVKKLPLPQYRTTNFRQEQFRGFSYGQINDHLELYRGYVDKRNDIVDMLNNVSLRDANNRSFSVYRSLKLAEIYTMNADILHRLYFENITNKPTKPSQQMINLIIEAYGSLSDFKEDFFAAAMSGHGWVMTGYSLDDNRIHNFMLEAHNQSILILTMPLLIVDVYEHAYMIDFGIKRLAYLDQFWSRINWDVVEDRINKWVNPLRLTNA